MSKLRRPEELLIPRPEGLYCPPGDFFVDPSRKVDRAVITHGHSDHARRGHARVLATIETLDFMQLRYGKNYCRQAQPLAFGEVITLNGVKVWLLPAGHVMGSAQVVMEKDGVRAIVSGDFKRAPDPTCLPFEPLTCDVFVTEATFALPVYRHPPAQDEITRLTRSLRVFSNRAHLMGAYSLGKAQRLIALLRQANHDAPIYVSKSVADHCAVYEHHGVALGQLRQVEGGLTDGGKGAVILAPAQSFREDNKAVLTGSISGFASGWMRLRATAKARGGDLPLIISDHADWDELTTTLLDIAPGELWITHGRADALAHYAKTHGIHARALSDVREGGQA
jgi:putative mRNA 3-end processing factor